MKKERDRERERESKREREKERETERDRERQRDTERGIYFKSRAVNFIKICRPRFPNFSDQFMT